MPLGYRFDVESPMQPRDAKAALRKDLKGWFDTRKGPRGWVIGPLVCLWLSAYDKQGPMIIGLVSDRDFGSRVHGRAGSDLNGIALLAILLVIFVWLGGRNILSAHFDSRLVLFLAIFVPLGLLALFCAHKDRAQADPLVRYIQRTVGTVPVLEQHWQGLAGLSNAPVAEAGVIVDGDPLPDRISPHKLGQIVVDMEPDSFVIVEFAPENYMQALLKHDRFLLEKREGSRDQHFKAAHELDRAELIEALTSYLQGMPVDSGIVWQSLSRGSLEGTVNRNWIAYGIGAVFVVMVGVLVWMKFQ